MQVFGLVVYGCVLLGVENQDCSAKQAFYFGAVHSNLSWGLVFFMFSFVCFNYYYCCGVHLHQCAPQHSIEVRGHSPLVLPSTWGPRIQLRS